MRCTAHGREWIFHQFGINGKPCGTGVMQFTVAIVEHVDTGDLQMIPIEHVSFLSDDPVTLDQTKPSGIRFPAFKLDDKGGEPVLGFGLDTRSESPCPDKPTPAPARPISSNDIISAVIKDIEGNGPIRRALMSEVEQIIGWWPHEMD